MSCFGAAAVCAMRSDQGSNRQRGALARETHFATSTGAAFASLLCAIIVLYLSLSVWEFDPSSVQPAGSSMLSG